MAKYSKKEFADLCGMKTGDLSNYEKRGKVVYTKDGFIDGENLHNKEFLLKRQRHSITKDAPPPPKVAKIIPKKEEEPIERSPRERDPEYDDGIADLDRQKRLLEIDKTKSEIALLNLKEQKQRGEVMPVEMVKVIFAQHTKSIIVEFNNSIDKILTKISKKKALTNEETSDARREVLQEINIAVDKSVEESKKNIGNIVDEFSEKKGKGERN